MDVRGIAGENSEGMGNILLKHEGKEIFLHSDQKLAELCPKIMWKAELVNNELGYLVEEYFQSVEDTAQFLLIASVKWKGKDTIQKNY